MFDTSVTVMVFSEESEGVLCPTARVVNLGVEGLGLGFRVES